jgi:hypothetical protein
MSGESEVRIPQAGSSFISKAFFWQARADRCNPSSRPGLLSRSRAGRRLPSGVAYSACRSKIRSYRVIYCRVNATACASPFRHVDTGADTIGRMTLARYETTAHQQRIRQTRLAA